MLKDRFAMADLTGGQMNAIVKKLGGHQGALRFLRDELKIVEAQPLKIDEVEPKKLLKLVTTVSVAATKIFTASDHFKVDTQKAAVRICSLGDNFKENLLGLSEGGCEATNIKVHKLLAHSSDLPIIEELADKCEIRLGQFFALLSKQGKGKKGVLLTNGKANVAYIRGVKGILWAVSAYWQTVSRGWLVVAVPTMDPTRWDPSYQILSR
ncbi:MAG TPA: hypothetical protein VMR46_03800 [Candidatus Paceibacterota bacterium]|nr:hypothetical protein [Candidatus Paceibacterota bacterium]